MQPTVPAHSTEINSPELDAVRLRRAELREALDGLERALAAPAAGRAGDWGKSVQAAVAEIADDWQTHVSLTEAPGGLHQSIRAASFRLIHAVDSLTAEHAEIAAEVAELVALTGDDITGADVEGIRDSATRLLGHIIKHRQRGADLVYEAYSLDIGGAD